MATNISNWLKVQSRWFKNYIFAKVYFDHIYFTFIIPSHFIIVPYLTLCVLDSFNTIRVSNSLDPDQARHFVRHYLGPNCLQRLSVDDKSCHKQAELNTEQLLDTTFWLKSISFGSNFFHLAKVLATTNSEPLKALNNIGADQAAQAGLPLCCSHATKTVFLRLWPI